MIARRAARARGAMGERVIDLRPRGEDLVRPYDCGVFDRRIGVWEDTRRAARGMRTPPSRKATYDPTARPTPRFPRTEIEITAEDTVACGTRLRSLHPVLLNFSDDVFAGGYVQSGSGAQEESIFRRSDYCNTLTSRFYPLGDGEAVYSPRVTVFKAAEEDAWVATEPVSFAFIACPAVKRPRLESGRMNEGDAERFRTKIRLVLQIAHAEGHRALVLGAFGCGAWCCPPAHVAELFRDELAACAGAFERVCFAIKDTPSSYEGNRFTGARETFASVLTGGRAAAD